MTQKKEKTAPAYISTVEDICHAFTYPLSSHETVQSKLEGILNYLVEQRVIDKYDANQLDWVFSDECSY